MRPHYIWTSFNYAQCRLGEVDDRVLRPSYCSGIPSSWFRMGVWLTVEGGGGADDPILAAFASYERHQKHIFVFITDA